MNEMTFLLHENVFHFYFILNFIELKCSHCFDMFHDGMAIITIVDDWQLKHSFTHSGVKVVWLNVFHYTILYNLSFHLARLKLNPMLNGKK